MPPHPRRGPKTPPEAADEPKAVPVSTGPLDGPRRSGVNSSASHQIAASRSSSPGLEVGKLLSRRWTTTPCASVLRNRRRRMFVEAAQQAEQPQAAGNHCSAKVAGRHGRLEAGNVAMNADVEASAPVQRRTPSHDGDEPAPHHQIARHTRDQRRRTPFRRTRRRSFKNDPAHPESAENLSKAKSAPSNALPEPSVA